MAAEQREPTIPLPGDARSGDQRRAARGDAEATPTRTGPGSAALIGALVLGLVLGALGMKLLGGTTDGDPFAGSIDEGGYQAVILSNDKVYFGRLSVTSDTFFELDDAFFLRETRDSPDSEPVRALLPVNRELHAPENRMLIRRDEVVLVENLADDSPLLAEIERQKGGGSGDADDTEE